MCEGRKTTIEKTLEESFPMGASGFLRLRPKALKSCQFRGMSHDPTMMPCDFPSVWTLSCSSCFGSN